MRQILSFALLVACRRPDGADSGEPRADTDSDADTDVAASWTALPGGCDPGAAGADPITPLGRIQLTQNSPGEYFVELIDLEIHGDLALGVGQGGLIVYDVADPLVPRHLGHFPLANGRYHRVEALEPPFVAVSHRERGLEILDISDPAAIVPVSRLSGMGWEGMARSGDRLYVASRTEGVVVVDIADPRAPRVIAAVPGLSSPWELAPIVDGWTWAADNTLGIVPIDVRDPDLPVVGAPVDIGGPAMHVAVAEGHLYVAGGGQGIVVLDASDPSAPRVVARQTVSGSAVAVDVAGGVLVSADHEGLIAWDVFEPGAPLPLGRQRGEQHALTARLASPEVAWLGDWSLLEGWAIDAAARSGELDVARDPITLPEGGGVEEVEASNRGGGELRWISGAVDDPRVSIEVAEASIAPGAVGRLRLSWASDGAPLDAELCLVTDDPDDPVTRVAVRSGVAEPPVGDPAPDFVLEDLDGVPHRLSEQLGHPVVLAYFATW